MSYDDRSASSVIWSDMYTGCSLQWQALRRSGFGSSIDGGAELVEPVRCLELEVEVEDVVGADRRTAVRFGELRREPPHLQPNVRRHQQVRDATAGVLGDGHAALRTLEAVRP